MFLRTKTFIIITVIFICAFLILALIVNLLVSQGYHQEEDRLVQDKIELIQLLIDDSIRSMEKVAVDWAEWNDTYTFVEDNNQTFIDSNFQDSSFFNNRWNLVVILNASGDVVYSKAYDLIQGKSSNIPEAFNNYIAPGSMLLTSSETDNIKGIISLPEDPMIIISHPVLTSQGSGPRRGTFIVGRYLNSMEVERLSNITNLNIQAYTLQNTQISPEIQSIYPRLLQNPVIEQPVDDNTMAGFGLIKDINEKPVLVIKIDLPRPLMVQSKSVIFYFTLSLLAFGLVFVLAVLLILDRIVLSRISNIGRSVNNIAQKGDPSSRIEVNGKDEISNLAANINKMLDSLAQSIKLQRESEEFRSGLLNNSPYPILVSNPDNSVRYVNPAFESVTGYSSQEIAGSTMPYPWWPADKVDQYLEKFKNQLNQPHQIEIMLKRKTGEFFWVNTNHTLIKDENTVKYCLSIWMDITSQKLAREELEQFYQREKNVREQLQIEIKSRAEFTRALVHELKTPLTPILASSELLVEELTEEPLLGLAKNVHRGAENMNKRVDELLDLARGEVGMLKINLKPVDLSKLLQEVYSNMKPVVQNSGQTLTLDIKSQLPVTLADDDRIRQVLLNLINNAIKYSPRGGKINVRAGLIDSSILMEVQDTGRGISEEEQKNLFKPYYRIEGKERLSGLGLGLTLSKNLIELHGGSIWVTSKKGIGSTFSFSIPLKTRIPQSEETISGGKA